MFCRLWNDSHSHINTRLSSMKQDSLSKWDILDSHKGFFFSTPPPFTNVRRSKAFCISFQTCILELWSMNREQIVLLLQGIALILVFEEGRAQNENLTHHLWKSLFSIAACNVGYHLLLICLEISPVWERKAIFLHL